MTSTNSAPLTVRAPVPVGPPLFIYQSFLHPTADRHFSTRVMDTLVRMRQYRRELTSEEVDTLYVMMARAFLPDLQIEEMIPLDDTSTPGIRAEAEWAIDDELALLARNMIRDIENASGLTFDIRYRTVEPVEDVDPALLPRPLSNGFLPPPYDPEGSISSDDDDVDDEPYNEATYCNLVASAARERRHYINRYETEAERIQREEAEEDEDRIDEMEGWQTMRLRPEAAEEFQEHFGGPAPYSGLCQARRGSRQGRQPRRPGVREQIRNTHLDSDSE